jgi:hypothetical protein
MVDVASAWAQDDPVSAAEWVQQNVSGEALNRAMADVLGPLSKVDPQLAANDLARMSDLGGWGIINRGASLAAISRNWAEQDPQADIAWLNSVANNFAPAGNTNGGGPGQSYYLSAVSSAISTWATNDTDAATAYVESLGVDDPQFPRLIGAVANSRFQTDPTTVTAWAESLPNDGTRSTAINSVVTPLAAMDPQQALNLALEIPDGTYQDSAVGRVIGTWSATDPATAAQALANLPEGDALDNATQRVAANWIQTDPAAAAQWINSLPPGNARDSAAGQEVQALASNNSSAAFAWAASIDDANTQSDDLNSVVQTWARTDPNAAAAAVQSANVSDDTRTRLMNTIQQNAPQQ